MDDKDRINHERAILEYLAKYGEQDFTTLNYNVILNTYDLERDIDRLLKDGKIHGVTYSYDLGRIFYYITEYGKAELLTDNERLILNYIALTDEAYYHDICDYSEIPPDDLDSILKGLMQRQFLMRKEDDVHDTIYHITISGRKMLW